MPERVPFFQRKVTLAILGTLLLGGASMAFALATGPHPGVTAAGSKSAISQQPQGGAPDATATTAPTNVPPAPQPTSPPIGQTVELQTIIASVIPPNTFTLQNSSVVVVVTSSTQWDSCSFSTLRSGQSVHVVGQLANGNVLASYVHAELP